MYELLAHELIEPNSELRFLGKRKLCRYCSSTGKGIFGKKTNAHLLPIGLGNRTLFSLDECKACNDKFSVYEDALCKAVGPFLTLGGVRGRSGVRKTGRSGSKSTVRHTEADGLRRLSFAYKGDTKPMMSCDQTTGILRWSMPIEGDKFIPRYAYKALTKIGLSILPHEELPKFQKSIASLQSQDATPHNSPHQVGFSYAYVGNAVPALAISLWRRKDIHGRSPYVVLFLMAGSVCFQIWLRSDELDEHVPDVVRLGVRFNAQLPKSEGGYFPVVYSDPLQFDWTSLEARPQPFQTFEFAFNPMTTEGSITPVFKL